MAEEQDEVPFIGQSDRKGSTHIMAEQKHGLRVVLVWSNSSKVKYQGNRSTGV